MSARRWKNSATSRHGIYPAALTDGGLGVGLRTLAETSPVPLAIEGPGLRRQPAAVEAAAYRMVADAVHAAWAASQPGSRHGDHQRHR